MKTGIFVQNNAWNKHFDSFRRVRIDDWKNKNERNQKQ